MISRIKQIGTSLEKTSFPTLRLIRFIGGLAMIIMMLVTVCDAVGRKLQHPIYGAYEIVSFFLGVLVFFSIAYCALNKKHLVVNIVTERLPNHLRFSLVSLTYIISVITSWVLGWRLLLYSLDQMNVGATGMDIVIPTWPFIMAAAFCAIVLGWVFLVQTIGYLGEIKQEK